MTKTYLFKRIDKNGKEGKKLIAKPCKKRAFLLRIRTLNAQKGSQYYLRVSYGREMDCFGRNALFENEGVYSSKKELIHAFKCFDKQESSIQKKGQELF